MQLTVGENGNGTVRLGFGRQPSESQLLEIGQDLTTSAFIDAPVTPTIDSNDGGYPFLVTKSAKIFEPGAHPQVLIDTAALHADLVLGAGTADPARVGTDTVTGRRRGFDDRQLRRGTLTMSPQPWRWWAVMGIVAANLVASRLRRSSRNRHYEVVAWGLLACVSFGVAIFTSPSGQVDNMLVRWRVSAGVSRC